MSVFRPSYHSPIPADAHFSTKKGKQFARFRLSRSGEQVTGEVLPSGKARIVSPFWYARIRRNGKTTRVPLGVTDRTSAEQIAAQLQLAAQHQRAGIIDPYAEHRDKRMLDHLDDYISHLECKCCCPKHIKETKRVITAVLTACNFEYPENLSQPILNRYLSQLIKKGRSYRTRNIALKQLRALVNWMVKSDRLASDPFKLCDVLNTDADPNSKRRRALPPADLARLCEAAHVGIEREGVSGPERALLYMTAATTGLRRGELAKLLVRDFNLNVDVPYVYPPGHVAKNRRPEPIPLHPAVAARLLDWQAGKTPTEHVFHLISATGYLRSTSKMMKHDCQAAGIAYEDHYGKADFHGHRAAYITALCRSGADLSLVVRLARHSDSRLTTRVYDKVQLQDKARVIALLPAPNQISS